MGWLDFLLLPLKVVLGTAEAVTPGDTVPNIPQTTDGGTDDDAMRARLQLAAFVGGLIAVVSAPAIYALSKTQKGRKKKKMTDKELMVGQSLENASAQATGLLMTAVATPALATALAYILVQKMEDGRIITKGLGNATQGLLTVAAAGPAIQGIGQIAGSAFKRGK